MCYSLWYKAPTMLPAGSLEAEEQCHTGLLTAYEQEHLHRPPLPPGNIPGTHFCWMLSQPQGQCAAGRFMSIKNSNDTIGNRTRDLPNCSAVLHGVIK